MRHFYSLIFRIVVALLLVTVISSCSENEDDVSAPSIIIIKPTENDTIHLSKSKVFIEVKAENNADISNLRMTVNTQTGKLLYNYVEDQIDKHRFTCSEDFTYDDLYMLTKVKLIVTCENEFHAWRKKEVNFYITR